MVISLGFLGDFLGVSRGFPFDFSHKVGGTFYFTSDIQIFVFESIVIYLQEDNKEENCFKRPGWLFLSFLNRLLHHLQMNITS